MSIFYFFQDKWWVFIMLLIGIICSRNSARISIQRIYHFMVVALLSIASYGFAVVTVEVPFHLYSWFSQGVLGIICGCWAIWFAEFQVFRGRSYGQLNRSKSIVHSAILGGVIGILLQITLVFLANQIIEHIPPFAYLLPKSFRFLPHEPILLFSVLPITGYISFAIRKWRLTRIPNGFAE